MLWEKRILAFIGPMCSGKTEKLCAVARQIIRMRQHGQDIPFVWLRPSRDTRDAGTDQIVSHGGPQLEGIEIVIINAQRPSDMLRHPKVRAAKVVLVDEGQFWGRGLRRALLKLYQQGKSVFFAGLDTDHMGRPFTTTADVVLMPEVKVYRLRDAVCIRCGEGATRSLRLIDGMPAPRDSPQFLVQGTKGVSYEPVCLSCFIQVYQDIGIRVI
ncbi:MAG: hypothetical protein PHI73_03020 [Patescibacteria group bacterium]|nr:hypothetical protein [Patescibacteria group bacterium]